MKTTFVAIGLFIILAYANALPLRESSQDNIEPRANDEKVKFYLYTASNPSTAQQLIIGNADSVNKSNFSKSRQTRIIIHGWGGSYTSSPNRPVREAYLSKDNYNIISVDWNEYSKLNYLSAKNKVPVVGKEVAKLVDYLNEKFAMNLASLVVIGHSLGAHVAGFCGKEVTRGKLPAIVGLDPAFPLYSYENCATRLCETDAKYVQTIQTNGGVKGFLKPIGSASFYANYGRDQPGCGTDLDGSCSHGRCVNYYAEAVKGYSFTPYSECDYDEIVKKSGCKKINSVQIGDPLSVERINGIFNFETTSAAPFGHLKDRK